MSSISSVGGSSQAWAALGAQRSQQQAKMFAKVDTDGSGSVDASELGTLLAKVSEKTGTSVGDASEVLKTMDSDGDGALSSGELQKGMQALFPPPSTMAFAQSRTGTTGTTDSQGQDDLFAKVDTDGSGALSEDELNALSERMQADGMGGEAPSFSKLDSNGDGSLSQAEFEAGRPAPPQGAAQGQGPMGGPPPMGGPGGPGGAGGAQASSSTSSADSELDTNGDGVVSELERLAGNLKQLASAAESDSSGDAVNAEIAKLAQKLYDQISTHWLGSSTSSGTSSLSATA
jgi:Ca2+-binding EF-hand superfamily protein